MKKHLSTVLLVSAAALLSACASLQETGQSALVGNWTNPLGAVWAIKPDGTFQVALNGTDRVSVSGKYTATGDTINIQESHGSKTPKSCRGPAAYKFVRTGDTLTFTKVSDKCKLREKNILAGWKATKPKKS